MPLLDKIIWQIETSLDQDLSLQCLSDRCAISTHHMCRTFQQATGLSVMAYVRARRLSEAAKQIASGKTDLMTIALDAGYGSHEAFTRAFTALFGILPSTLAKAQSFATLTLTEPYSMKHDMIVETAPHRIEHHVATYITGLAINCTFENNAEIPNLWQRFGARLGELTPVHADITYGICFNTDQAGNFRYLAGLEAPERPQGMETVKIPQHRYAVFTHDGHITDFPKTVYTIWNKAIPDAGLKTTSTPDFEKYDKRFNPTTGFGIVEVWVPVTDENGAR